MRRENRQRRIGTPCQKKNLVFDDRARRAFRDLLSFLRPRLCSLSIFASSRWVPIQKTPPPPPPCRGTVVPLFSSPDSFLSSWLSTLARSRPHRLLTRKNTTLQPKKKKKKLSLSRHAVMPALLLRSVRPPKPSATTTTTRKRPRPPGKPAGSAWAREPAAATGAAVATRRSGSCCRAPARGRCTPPASRGGSCTLRARPRRRAAGSARGSSPTGRAC